MKNNNNKIILQYLDAVTLFEIMHAAYIICNETYILDIYNS